MREVTSFTEFFVICTSTSQRQAQTIADEVGRQLKAIGELPVSVEGYDAAAVVEVIEHLDAPRLAAFERVLFQFARPRTVVLTTPNVEYNVRWQSLPAGRFRHRDHRFEWTRAEFRSWAAGIEERFGYGARFLPVGPEDSEVGPPTQMAVFLLNA